jgi:hypothetical protein
MLHSFEEDPRTSSQVQVDLDCVDVTISMYAVDDRRGERKARSVFRAEREDWTAVTGTYRQFKEESGFSSLGMPSYEEAGEVWVVTDKPSGAGVLLIAGAAEVHRTSNGGQLAWIWVHPLRRGSKKKYTLWLANRLRDEYGTLIALSEDIINGDITPAGIRFLNHHFPTPQA